MPSLQQLNDAVMAFIAEHPDSLITVVVDATFGHRINSGEVPEFDAAVANNEVVAPPAGAIGRGDAFLLSVANKVGATVLSNDSFQEFHGTYTWLFEEGRLIGGKPVPHIGWVFVARTPVRGPISRSAVKDARRRKEGGAPAAPAERGGRGRRGEKRPAVSPEASLPMPVPKAPPPNATIGQGKPAAPAKPTAAPVKPAATAASAVNDFNSFLSFVEHHPIGTSVNATVETYSSHGAYVKLEGGVVGYVPLRLMSDPPPRSAREFLKVGDAVTLVVESFAPARRSIDLAMTSMATAKPPAAAKRTRKAAAAADPTAPEPVGEELPAKKAGSRRKKAAAPAAEAPSEQAIVDAVPGAAVPAEPVRPSKRSAKAATPATAAKTEKATKATKAGKATKKASAEPEATDASAAVPPEASTAPAKKSRSKKASAALSAAPAPVPEPEKPATTAKPRGGKKAAATDARSPLEPAAESAATVPAKAASSRRRGTARPKA